MTKLNLIILKNSHYEIYPIVSPTHSTILLVTLFLLSFNLSAQIKVYPGGKIGIGTSNVSGYKMHIHADMENMGLRVATNNNVLYGYVSQFESAGPLMKAIAISLNGSDNGYWLSNGEVWGTGLFTFSDQRLKTKIIDIDDPIGRIMKLRGVFYYYKPSSSLKGFGLSLIDTSRKIGFIAQEGLYYPVVVASGANVSLRAAYLIELNEGFEIDDNAEFFADVIGGCDEGF